jgi:hypothetical protein
MKDLHGCDQLLLKQSQLTAENTLCYKKFRGCKKYSVCTSPNLSLTQKMSNVSMIHFSAMACNEKDYMDCQFQNFATDNLVTLYFTSHNVDNLTINSTNLS